MRLPAVIAALSAGAGGGRAADADVVAVVGTLAGAGSAAGAGPVVLSMVCTGEATWVDVCGPGLRRWSTGRSGEGAASGADVVVVSRLAVAWGWYAAGPLGRLWAVLSA